MAPLTPLPGRTKRLWTGGWEFRRLMPGPAGTFRFRHGDVRRWPDCKPFWRKRPPLVVFFPARPGREGGGARRTREQSGRLPQHGSA